MNRFRLAVVVVFGVLGFIQSESGVSAQTKVREANNGNVVLEDIPEVPQAVIDSLNRYENIRSAGFDCWSRDGKSMYITTRFGDVSQIHRVDMPGGARRQLTFFAEPIGSVTRQPGGDLLGFTMDAGGNEKDQIFLLNPASGDSQMLSDGKSRNQYMVWTRDGTGMAYQSTRRNGRSNDIWFAAISQQEADRLLWEAPDGSAWAPVDWSGKDKQLLIQQFVSITDSRIYLLDLQSGERKLLAGSETEPSRNLIDFQSSFDRTGQGIYFVTDRSSDFAQLAYLDLGDNSVSILSQDIPWDVERIELSEDRTRVALIVNEGGVSRLYLFDPQTREYRRVDEFPVGVIGSLGFCPDNSGLAVSISSAASSSDVFVLSLGENPLESKKLEQWTFSEVGGLETSNFVQPELITYPTFDEVDGRRREIPAFVYKPRGEGPYPVIIAIHGGPESQFRPSFSSRTQLWTDKLGIAVIAPNVRGSNGYGKQYVRLDNGMLRENSVKDIGALLDWIETQPDLDKNRVAVYGGSYGGYMVLASVMHYSDRLKAAVDVVGISNFVTFLENTEDYRRDLRRVEYGDERDPQMRAFLEQISPTNHVENMKTPLLVIQGQNDPRVPVTEAEQIVKRLREQGTQIWYMNALNEGHGYRKKENYDLHQQVIVMFFRKYLLGED